MRYRLRTLMVLLAVLPPVLAVFWWIVEPDPFGAWAVFVGTAIFASIPALVLVAIASLNREGEERKP